MITDFRLNIYIYIVYVYILTKNLVLGNDLPGIIL